MIKNGGIVPGYKLPGEIILNKAQAENLFKHMKKDSLNSRIKGNQTHKIAEKLTDEIFTFYQPKIEIRNRIIAALIIIIGCILIGWGMSLL